mmetsp:Transcript_8449/g.14171  ORF Transcript_8449/g.14171 Transcript_8449/m.14171 type:complete len:138 (-) Transcript_8449:109-522(-)
MPSEYESFRYNNYNDLKGHIPPRDIALIRLLSRFDGHMVRQGVKYLTTTNFRDFNHIDTPEMMQWFKGYDFHVPNMTLDEFRNFVRYKHLTGWTSFHYREWEIERLYMETQGNYGAFHQYYHTYRDVFFGSRANLRG